MSIFDQTNTMDAVKKIDAFRVTQGVDFLKYLKDRHQDSDNVKTPINFMADVEAKILGVGSVSGATLPWKKTEENFRFRPGEVTLWTGFNGHKKSMLLGYVTLNFIQNDAPVAIASFEMRPVSTIHRMLRQSLGVLSPDCAGFVDFLSWSDKKLFLYDQMGGVSAERLYGVIYYCADTLGIKHFVIDSLMRVIAGEDNYNSQKDFVVKLCEISQKTGVHIHLVHHMKKGDESKPSGRYDAKGSGALSDNVHNSLIVWSHKGEKHDYSTPDTVVVCDKQREGEWEGKIGLWFNPQSLQFSEFQTSESVRWVK